MKKQLSIIMCGVMLGLTLTSCSETQNEFYSKLKQVNSWEAKQINLKSSISVISSEDNENRSIDLTADGYLNNLDKQASLTFSITDPTDEVYLSDIKVLVDDTDCYLDKNYYASIYNNYPEAKDYINSLESDYICVTPENSLLDSTANKFYDNEFVYTLYEQMASRLGMDFPVSKNENIYSVSIDGEQLVDESLKMYDNFVNDLDAINNDFKLGLTQDVINSVKSHYNKDNFEIFVSVIRAMIKNSSINIAYDFKDENTVDVNMDFNIPIIIPTDIAENITITIKANLDFQINEAEVQTIEMPTSSPRLTPQQLNAILEPVYTIDNSEDITIPPLQ